MKTPLSLLLFSGLITLALSSTGAEHPELEPFPVAEEGMERFVIVLPHKERGEEDDFRVELIVGKQMLTDGVNLVRLGSTIQPRMLQGWGYTYYEVTGPSETLSTMMAPPEGTQMVETFVTAAPLHIRYNSRLPIVIYAPQGYEARYRIWTASDVTEKAENG